MTDTATADRSGACTGRSLTVRQAACIGVGSMVGAGIFSLLAVAGAGAAVGSAVRLSFLLAGVAARFRFPAGMSDRFRLATDTTSIRRRGHG